MNHTHNLEKHISKGNAIIHIPQLELNLVLSFSPRLQDSKAKLFWFTAVDLFEDPAKLIFSFER